MNAKVPPFLNSLKTRNPPAAAVPLLRAVWHGLHGEWFARRGEHSQKPPIAHEWFERLWPHTSRVELFAREHRSGWDSWGPDLPVLEPVEMPPPSEDRAA